MNWVDLVILGGLGFASWTGYRRGAILQLFSWGGFVLGILIGALVAPPLVRVFDPKDPTTRAIVALAAFLGVAFVIEAIVAFGGSRIAGKVTAVRARQIDRGVGAAVAGVLLVLASWLISQSARTVEPVANALRGSAILRATHEVFGTPPDIMASIGRFFGSTGFPEVFAQLNPSLAPGVAAPPRELANNPNIRAAARLTYLVRSPGCNGQVSGSGFPIRQGLVITAAHVVAGTHGTQLIEAQTGTRYPATVVYMDAQKDIAVLYVPTLPNRRLTVEDDPAARGTDGAAIGYPGGGPQKISVARVRVRTEAVGYDIYSERRVTRSIYVLRATVIRGNSGGPLVDTNGRVRGMVFAASAQNKEESYALTEDEIDRALARSIGRRAGVNTGRCAI